MTQRVSSYLVFLSLMLLGGCASSITLETSANVPEPLVQPYPLKAAIYFPEATRNHVYKADNRDGRNWSVSTGASQVALFSKLLGPCLLLLRSLQRQTM